MIIQDTVILMTFRINHQGTLRDEERNDNPLKCFQNENHTLSASCNNSKFCQGSHVYL